MAMASSTNPAKAATKSPPQARRTQADRSAATRHAAINAAIALLHEVGYAATSTTLVQMRAGLSRGAMLHQFPTKARLMAAVLEHVFVLHRAAYAAALAPLGDARAQLLALPRAAWALFYQAPAAAELEISLAARSDAELAGAVKPVRMRIDAMAHSAFADLARAADIREDAIEGLFGLALSAVRGLQAQWIVSPQNAPAEATLIALERAVFAEIARADAVRTKKQKTGRPE